MLDQQLTDQLAQYLTHLRQSVTLVASLDDSPAAAEMRALLHEIAALLPMISVREDGTATRRPSFRIERDGSDVGVDFAGIPLGHEFTSLVLALLHVGGHPPKMSAETAAAIAALEGDYLFETYYALSCQNCPDVVQALNMMSALNPRIRHVAIDGALYQEEVQARGVMAVPSVYMNGAPFAQGRMDLDAILAKLDSNAATRRAAALADKPLYDVLVVGGGPAGAAAAIYAARKGISTGLVAERFGGQVGDTLGIENFISVGHTEGPQLVRAMEAHVQSYDVDVMAGERAAALIPAAQAGAPHQVQLANGATLSARTIILSTGARWRQMGVPGEETYRNKGVAYCPHCDGPLFKGKPVAVIGGGNSGVEAAIDLAGLAAHVTLIEYAETLRADAVLQDRLRALPNVTIITHSETQEVLGDGHKVTGLRTRDRGTGAETLLALEGIFVQIGLVPNSDWLADALALSPRGEIIVDAQGATSVPGIFAAGDATTVPYKQIVIAMGEGAKAALAAFDHLIRLPVPEKDRAALAA